MPVVYRSNINDDFYINQDGVRTAIPINTGFGLGPITGNTTLTGAENVVLCDATSGPFTVTLPPSADVINRIIHIKKIDISGNVITIEPDGSETIDDETEARLEIKNESFMLWNNGSNWYVL